MKNRIEGQQPQEKDRHLDVPSEANRDMHANFLDASDDSSTNSRKDSATEERQHQWKEGIEAGKKARNEDKHE